MPVSLFRTTWKQAERLFTFGWVSGRMTKALPIKPLIDQDLEGRMHRPMTFRAKYSGVSVLAFRRVALSFFVCLVLVFSVSDTAAASFLSIISGQSAEPEEAALLEDIALNVQTMQVLAAARHIDPNLSRGGATLNVVDGVSLVAEESPFAGSAGAQSVPGNADQIAWYSVQEGDTLSQVATLFDVSVNTIVWANELGSDKDIHPGQTLLILPISGIQHTVEKGDTLASIAKDYGGDRDEIIAYNSLAEDGTLTVGEVITIPGGEMYEEEEETTVSSAKPASGGTVVSSGPTVSGYFIHPLPGAVRTQGIHGYNGVDYGASVGTPIRAAAAGTVIVSRAAGWNGGYGQYVVIDHPNGTQTLYAHLSRNAVWQGQKVVAGQVVGDVGNTGKSTGPHLHFEVRGAQNTF